MSASDAPAMARRISANRCSRSQNPPRESRVSRRCPGRPPAPQRAGGLPGHRRLTRDSRGGFWLRAQRFAEIRRAMAGASDADIESYRVETAAVDALPGEGLDDAPAAR